MSLRMFLKTVGVTFQQKIEKAVRDAREAGTLPAGPLKAKVVPSVDGVNRTHVVEGEITA